MVFFNEQNPNIFPTVEREIVLAICRNIQLYGMCTAWTLRQNGLRLRARKSSAAARSWETYCDIDERLTKSGRQVPPEVVAQLCSLALRLILVRP